MNIPGFSGLRGRVENLYEEDMESNIVEIGLRRQLDPLTVISAGVGAGLGDESPDLIFTVGLQRSF